MKALLFAFAFAALCAPCAAQGLEEANAAQVSACLTPGPAERGAPEYPRGAVRTDSEGRVDVEAEFSGPDVPPKVTVTRSSGDSELDGSVERYFSRFRAPCMRAGQQSVRLRQTFEFHLDRSVDKMAATRLDLQQPELAACLQRADGLLRPRYPLDPANATVLAKVLFTAAGKEPEVTLLAPSSSQALNESIATFMRGYRLPCMGERAVAGEQLFQFRRIERAVHLDAKLPEFLHLVREERKQGAVFDTTTMACPFKVRLEYWEPLRRNKIDEPGGVAAARVAFVQWLASLRADAHPDIEELLVGDSLTIDVPCMKIGA